MGSRTVSNSCELPTTKIQARLSLPSTAPLICWELSIVLTIFVGRPSMLDANFSKIKAHSPKLSYTFYILDPPFRMTYDSFHFVFCISCYLLVNLLRLFGLAAHHFRPGDRHFMCLVRGGFLLRSRCMCSWLGLLPARGFWPERRPLL